MPLPRMDALCGGHKVFIDRGPKRKSETPLPPNLSEKDCLPLPSNTVRCTCPSLSTHLLPGGYPSPPLTH